MFSKLSGIFKKSKADDTSAETSAEPTEADAQKAETPNAGSPTKTVVMRDAPKKTYGKAQEDPPKKTGEKKAPAKKTEEKKPAEKKAPAKTPTKKTSEKKAPAKEGPHIVTGSMPTELKEFEKELKNYAQHSRMPFGPGTANAVFTEYMAGVFRGLGYKMVLMRDQDNGIITMLDNGNGSKGSDDDSAIRNKLVVKCVYIKKGIVNALPVASAQEEGVRNRADEVWCITTTDFGDDAVRKSRKKDAKVRLYNGQKLYKEFLSKNENGW